MHHQFTLEAKSRESRKVELLRGWTARGERQKATFFRFRSRVGIRVVDDHVWKCFFFFFFLEGKKVSSILTSLTLFFIFIGGGLGSILERRRWMDGGLESSGRGRK